MPNKTERLKAIQDRILFSGNNYQETIIGFVCPITKGLTSSYHLVKGKWTATAKIPNVFFAEILKPMFLNPPLIEKICIMR